MRKEELSLTNVYFSISTNQSVNATFQEYVFSKIKTILQTAYSILMVAAVRQRRCADEDFYMHEVSRATAR